MKHLQNHHGDRVNIQSMNFGVPSTSHNAFNINDFIQKEKTEIKPEENVAEKEPEPRDKFNEVIDTNTSQRKHTSFHSKICEICSPNMKRDTCEKKISCANAVILEPLILPEEQRHTVSAVGQLEEKLSENCGEDISDKEKINCVDKN